ncbi:glycosyltransferase family 32 protein [Halomonas halmophila]|nr:glycosyltransferase [Halomonas halmophila]
MTKIPKNILQFCHAKEDAPDKLIQASMDTESNLPQYDYFMADDNFIKKLIIDHWDYSLYNWYCNNRIPASRADLARLLLVYHYGGIYVDLSMKIKTSFDRYLNNDLVLLRRDDFSKYASNPGKAHFTNSIIGAPQNSEIILSFINRVRLNFYLGKFNYDVINCTGPGVINDIVSYCSDRISLYPLSFKKSINVLFDYVRVKGFSNTWVELQKKGIFSEEDPKDVFLSQEDGKEKGESPSSPSGSNRAKASHFIPDIQSDNESVLYLHFGWPKVGSTTVQDFFRNTDFGKHCIYPLNGRPNNVRAHHQLVKNKFCGPVADRVISEISNYNKAVISSEQGIVDLYKEGFVNGLQDFIHRCGKQVKIYIYLKNIFSFVESSYSQCLKTDLFEIAPKDYKGSIKKFVEDAFASNCSHLLEYSRVVNYLEDILPAGCLNVRCVGVNMQGENVLEDFLLQSGLGNFSESGLAQRSNESIGIYEKALLRLFNTKGVDRASKFHALRDFSSLRPGYADLKMDADFCTIQDSFPYLSRLQQGVVSANGNHIDLLSRLARFDKSELSKTTYVDLCKRAELDELVPFYFK